jgi:ketosteroid isomerase-like protein
MFRRLVNGFAPCDKPAMQTASDRAEVTDLVHRYALHIRRGDPSQAAALFSSDGAFEIREMDPADPGSLTVRNRAEGADAVAAYISASTASARMVPMIHNLIVDLDGDRASASSLMVGRIWPTEREITGEYADSFRREAGGWRFSERIYTIWRSPG